MLCKYNSSNRNYNQSCIGQKRHYLCKYKRKTGYGNHGNPNYQCCASARSIIKNSLSCQACPVQIGDSCSPARYNNGYKTGPSQSIKSHIAGIKLNNLFSHKNSCARTHNPGSNPCNIMPKKHSRTCSIAI